MQSLALLPAMSRSGLQAVSLWDLNVLKKFVIPTNGRNLLQQNVATPFMEALHPFSPTNIY